MTHHGYDEIPPFPASYTAGTVLGRLMDGVGFRYRWATDGLSDQDLDYKPGESCRSIGETVNHVHSLAVMIENAFTGERYDMSAPDSTLSFDDTRAATLAKIVQISDRLKAAPDAVFDEMPLKFKMGEDEPEFPFWNAINGPIVDMAYHVGQIVSSRRAAGNPIDPAVQVFLGKRFEQ